MNEIKAVFKREVRGGIIYEEVNILGFTSNNGKIYAIVSYGTSRRISTSEGHSARINPIMSVELSDIEVIS